MTGPVGKKLLGLTAKALKKLSKGKKKKLSKKAACCLSNVKLLVSTLNLQGNMQAFNEMSKDVGLLEKFSKRLIKKHEAEDLAISKEVRETLSKAEIAIKTAEKIAELKDKIKALRENYFKNPKAKVAEYKSKLDDIDSSVKSLEKETDTATSPETITEGIKHLKDQLASAYTITKLKKHPKKIVDQAMTNLRMVSDQMQSLQSAPEIKRAFKAAEEENDDLSKCGEECIESARVVNQVIGEYMIKFVDKELRAIEEEIRAPLVMPKSSQASQKLLETLKSQKEKLLECQGLALKSKSGRAEDIQERITFALEDLNSRLQEIKNISS